MRAATGARETRERQDTSFLSNGRTGSLLRAAAARFSASEKKTRRESILFAYVIVVARRRLARPCRRTVDLVLNGQNISLGLLLDASSC